MLKVKRGDTVKLSTHKRARKFQVLGLAEPLPIVGGVTKVILQNKNKFYEVSIEEIQQKI